MSERVPDHLFDKAGLTERFSWVYAEALRARASEAALAARVEKLEGALREIATMNGTSARLIARAALDAPGGETTIRPTEEKT